MLKYLNRKKSVEAVLAECYYCGRRFPQLYKVTAEDIQRTYPPTLLGYEVACAECLDNLRSAASLVPQQTSSKLHEIWRGQFL